MTKPPKLYRIIRHPGSKSSSQEKIDEKTCLEHRIAVELPPTTTTTPPSGRKNKKEGGARGRGGTYVWLGRPPRRLPFIHLAYAHILS